MECINENGTNSCNSYTEANPNRNSSSIIRIRALDSSNWTVEEFNLLKKWEKEALRRAKSHSIYAYKFQRRSKWLRFATGLITTLTGSAGCVSFFIKLSQGIIIWQELIIGSITFLAGIIGAVGDAFDWETEYENHDRTANDFRKILSELRILISSPKLDRKECEFCINRLSSAMIAAEQDAPYVNKKFYDWEIDIKDNT